MGKPMGPEPLVQPTEVLPTDTSGLFESAVERAALLLRQGKLVAVPTETVYGLAANAFDATAVAEIFRVKGRPAGNPLIVHVADLNMARRCTVGWPESAARLASAFWPGPLTLVLPKSAEIPNLVTAGGETVGIRWPSHPLIQAVIRKCGFPLAAPSANSSNRLSPTTSLHVLKDLGGKIPLIIDGGASNVGIESTVIDLTTSPPAILRPGMIDELAIVSVIREVATRQGAGKTILRSPGQLPRHYCPRAKLEVWSWVSDSDLEAKVAARRLNPQAICILAHSAIPSSSVFGKISVIPREPEAFARALYAELHACDDCGAEMIVVEAVPASAAWSGVADRLQRASSGFSGPRV